MNKFDETLTAMEQDLEFRHAQNETELGVFMSANYDVIEEALQIAANKESEYENGK